MRRRQVEAQAGRSQVEAQPGRSKRYLAARSELGQAAALARAATAGDVDAAERVEPRGPRDVDAGVLEQRGRGTGVNGGAGGVVGGAEGAGGVVGVVGVHGEKANGLKNRRKK